MSTYISTVLEICPDVPRELLEIWTLGPVDALAISELLTSIGRPVTVFDVGTFVGGSAFTFACHPAVSHVVSIDPNPLIADEINDKREMLRTSADAVEATEFRVQDVAALALARYPEVAARIELRRGHLGSPSALSSAEATEAVPLPPSEGDGSQLVVFIDGEHTAEAVCKDLCEVFRQRPDALAILDDCRYAWGPFVQAGVARFLDERSGTDDRYRFRLVTDVVPILGRANLGTVYRAGHGRLDDVFQAFSRRFSGRMDLLRLLEREDELAHLLSATTQELKRVRERAVELNEERDVLAMRLKRTGRVADAAHDRVVDLEQSTSWRVTAPLRRLRGVQPTQDPR